MMNFANYHELSPVDRFLVDSKRAAMVNEWGQCLYAADMAMRIDPKRPEALFMAATALMKMNQEGCAMQLFNMATKVDPNRAEIWNNLGCAIKDYAPEEAYKAFMRAEALDPGRIDVASNICSAAGIMGRYAEAVEWADKVFEKSPGYRDALFNGAESLLSLGQWEKAWPRYKAAMGNASRQERNYHANRQTPRWNPHKQPNKRVVIYGEQGIGDEILFASMMDKAIATGAKIALECNPRLEAIFKRSFPEIEVYGTLGATFCEWPADFEPECKLEIGGLGEFFAPEPFRRGPFLKADPVKRAMAKAYLDASCKPGALRVGIAWTGGTWETGRLRRSIPVEDIYTLMRMPGIEFVCLEYEDATKDLETAPKPIHYPKSMVKKGADYDDAAALVAELDLVIAPTTSVIDLCGALGVPCWAMVDPAPQWRYAPVAGEKEMFVYEGVRLFRQKAGEPWKAVVQRVAAALATFGMEKAA